jgi:hypothetical protein
MIRPLILSLAVLLASCGTITETAVKSVAGAALGGSDGVSVDAQVGKTNSKTIGSSRNTEISGPVIRDAAIQQLDQDNRQDTGDKTGGVDRIENLDGGVTINNVPIWLIIALLGAALGALSLVGLIGWLSPQPAWVLKRKSA